MLSILALDFFIYNKSVVCFFYSVILIQSYLKLMYRLIFTKKLCAPGKKLIALLPIYTKKQVLNEIVWNNHHIKIEGYSIYYKKWHDAGLTKIEDFFQGNRFLTFEEYTRLAFFQYKIIHRILPTNSPPFRDSIKEYDKCHLCGERQTLIHIFVTCPEALIFLSRFTNWWNSKTGEKRSLSIKMK